MEQKKRGLTSYGLKWIAIITMFIDHAAAIIYERYLYTKPDFSFGEPSKDLYMYLGLRAIGRIAFPIYIFLMVQGFTHTRSKLKYALRLGAFALISEIPFNLGFQGTLTYLGYQNVFFTLLFGFLFMWAADYVSNTTIKPFVGFFGLSLGSLLSGSYIMLLIESFRGFQFGTSPFKIEMLVIALIVAAVLVVILILCNLKKDFNSLSRAGLIMLALSFFMWCGDLLSTDYGAMGVLAIAVAYFARNGKKKTLGLSLIPLVLASTLEAVAVIDLIPIHFYNGEKGKGMKYFFYAFYPCHILILFFIAKLLKLV